MEAWHNTTAHRETCYISKYNGWTAISLLLGYWSIADTVGGTILWSSRGWAPTWTAFICNTTRFPWRWPVLSFPSLRWQLLQNTLQNLVSRYEKTCNCQGFKAFISVNKATLDFKLKLPKNRKTGRGKNHYSGCHFSVTKESKTDTPFHGMLSFHGTSSLEEPTPDLQQTQGSMASSS